MIVQRYNPSDDLLDSAQAKAGMWSRFVFMSAFGVIKLMGGAGHTRTLFIIQFKNIFVQFAWPVVRWLKSLRTSAISSKGANVASSSRVCALASFKIFVPTKSGCLGVLSSALKV